MVILARFLRPSLTKMLMDWDYYLVLELLRYQCKSWRCSLLHENQVYQWLGSYPYLGVTWAFESIVYEPSFKDLTWLWNKNLWQYRRLFYVHLYRHLQVQRQCYHILYILWHFNGSVWASNFWTRPEKSAPPLSCSVIPNIWSVNA